MSRKNPFLLTAIVASILAIIFLTHRSPSLDSSSPLNKSTKSSLGSSLLSQSHLTGETGAGDGLYPIHVEKEVLHGDVIMPKLGNETIKAELGRASWKLFHTMLARFPEKPSPDEREALRSYIHLFARLYPCGECAAHFRKLLQQHPPQTSSRESASQWGCAVHNQVNARLKKEEFDCSTIAEKYKCGCADADKDKEAGGPKDGMVKVVKTTGGKSLKTGAEEGEMKLEREGLMRGD